MYLKHCKTLEELKRQYRSWTKKLHPDCGGSDEEMKALNQEFETMFKILSKGRQTTETAADFMRIVEDLLKLDGLVVEVCGSWLWISGNTYTHRDSLRKAGCRWASAKKLWYWRSPETVSTSHSSTSMERIRARYGSEVFESTATPRPALS